MTARAVARLSSLAVFLGTLAGCNWLPGVPVLSAPENLARMQARFKATIAAELPADAQPDWGTDGRNFLALLAQNRRLTLMPAIATQFEALRAEVENTLDVEVMTAFALTDEQRQHLAAALARRFKRQVRLAESVDASLVGGAIVRAGDLVIDGSVAGRLARLQQQISQP